MKVEQTRENCSEGRDKVEELGIFFKMSENCPLNNLRAEHKRVCGI